MTESVTSDADLASARIDHAIVMVDSEMAARWLKRNIKNRRPRQSVVARYLSDMEAGRWAFAADPIRFDINGNLLDGQHRLTALSAVPDITIPMLVVRGLPADSQSVMDQGTKRSSGDQLGLKGVKNASNVAAAVKQFIAWESNYLFRDQRLVGQITASRIEEWVDNHLADVDFLNTLAHLTRQHDAPPSIGGAAALAFGRIDQEGAHEFFALLARGAGTQGHPIVTLDKRLQSMRRSGVTVPARDYLAFFILAWNAWRDGRQMAKFQRPVGGRWSEDNFPEPH